MPTGPARNGGLSPRSRKPPRRSRRSGASSTRGSPTCSTGPRGGSRRPSPSPSRSATPWAASTCRSSVATRPPPTVWPGSSRPTAGTACGGRSAKRGSGPTSRCPSLNRRPSPRPPLLGRIWPAVLRLVPVVPVVPVTQNTYYNTTTPTVGGVVGGWGSLLKTPQTWGVRLGLGHGLGRQGAPPPWHDDSSWSPRLLQARGRDDKLDVMQTWIERAGGWLSGDQAQLPSDLPDCLARRELLRHCKSLGVQVCMGYRA